MTEANAKRAPRKEDAFDLLMRAFDTGASSDAIMSQEAAGQTSFVSSDTLPSEMQYDTRAVLEVAGVKFLGIVEDDPLFQWVELPPGWKKVPTDHSMWSNLVDDKGRKRASIFYKAAFYDRSAHIGAKRRYNYRIDYDKLDAGIAQAVVTDGGNEIHRTSAVEFVNDDSRARYDSQDSAHGEAKAWLAEHYPDWENAAAYWD